MRVMVIYNPVSGRGRSCKSAGAIAELLVCVPCDVELVQTKPTSPTQWLLPKLQYNPDAIVVVGGDGTLRQIASIAKDTNIPVYHAACGTENLFAKSMAVSGTPEVVVEKIKQRATSTIDTATANDSFMLLMAVRVSFVYRLLVSKTRESISGALFSMLRLSFPLTLS